jgi:hypothetical protein
MRILKEVNEKKREEDRVRKLKEAEERRIEEL